MAMMPSVSGSLEMGFFHGYVHLYICLYFIYIYIVDCDSLENYPLKTNLIVIVQWFGICWPTSTSRGVFHQAFLFDKGPECPVDK